jgi:hypothetical protein
MSAHAERSDAGTGPASQLDPDDADRLATEHGETDFAGFAPPTGDDEPRTATEEAAVSESDLETGEAHEGDRARPHSS